MELRALIGGSEDCGRSRIVIELDSSSFGVWLDPGEVHGVEVRGFFCFCGGGGDDVDGQKQKQKKEHKMRMDHKDYIY